METAWQETFWRTPPSGQTPGENSGYAMNQNAIQRCPEKLGHDWKWWNQPEGVWTLDDQAEISCR